MTHMPHQRARILEQILKESLGWSPVTAVFGQRQTGKTTLLKKLGADFETFDSASFLIEFSQNGSAILDAGKKPFFLDEVQKYPPVFDVIKLHVDQQRRPGQFLLTGSVRFAQRKPIRESLTGRTTLWELLPLVSSELFERPFRNFVSDALSTTPLKAFSKSWMTEQQLNTVLTRGGLPGICFLRSDKQRENTFQNHLATLIERDLPLIRQSKVTPPQLLSLLKLLAASQGEPINLAALSRKVRVSAPTLKSLLIALEGLFLIRHHGITYFFEDLGIVHYLDSIAANDPARGLMHWIFTELRAQAVYHRELISEFTEYRTRGGAYVPFVFHTKKSTTIGITFDPLNTPTEKSLKSLHSLRKKSRHGFMGISLNLSSETRMLDSGILSVPIKALV